MSLVHLPDVFFLRHGQTAWNAEKRYQGRKDIPLDDTGRAQADANGLFLRDILDEAGLDPERMKWTASPLGRARETIERVRKAFSPKSLPDIAFDSRLVEISYGDLEGRLQRDLSFEQMPPHGQRDDKFWYSRPQGGESFDDVSERVRAVIHEIDRPTVMVAHGGIVRVMRHVIAGDAQVDVVNWPVPQNGVMHFHKGKMRFIATPGLKSLQTDQAMGAD